MSDPEPLPPASSPSPSTRDIARVSGVSHVTVARVLNKHSGVSEATRRKVMEVAERLGYRPNPMVDALMTALQARKKPEFRATLAWVNSHRSQVEWNTRPYRRHYLEGARARCEELGFTLDELWTQEPGMKPDRFQKILLSRSIYGAVIPQAVNPRFFPEMDWSEFAVVTIGQPAYNAGWHCVESDAFKNMSEAFTQALKLGYQRPGLALNPMNANAEWGACFAWQQTHLPPAHRVPPLTFPENFEEYFGVFREWLHSQKPDVVICCDSRLVELAQRAGFGVPEDVGFIHMHLAEDVSGWSGIHQRDDEIGAAAVGLVAACLIRNERGIVKIPRRSLVPGMWIQGQTTRKVA